VSGTEDSRRRPENGTVPSAEDDLGGGETKDSLRQSSPVHFQIVLRDEIDAIRQRQEYLGRKQVDPIPEPEGGDDDSDTIPPVIETSGLALSGGGIRSAAFCLGALQALDATPASSANAQRREDRAEKTLTVLDHIDYLSTVSGGGYIGTSMVVGMASNGGSFPFKSQLDQDEPPSLQHIRDHSNYLLPHGFLDAAQSVAIYLRGLAANAILLLPVLLAASLVTIASIHFGGKTVPYLARVGGFEPSPLLPAALALGVVAVFLVIWAIARGFSVKAEVGGGWARTCVWGIAIALVLAFLGAQSILLNYLWGERSSSAPGLSVRLADWIDSLAAILALLAAMIGLLGGRIGNAVETGDSVPTWQAWLGGLAGRAAVWIGALAVLLLLWLVYLHLTFWARESIFIVRAYIAVAFVAVLIGYFLLKPNANSMHRLYRERLGKAFHFVPPSSPLALGQDPEPRDTLPIHEIATSYAPYPLINAALNIHGSEFANRRGRNAEFFIFSPQYIGSDATQYCTAEAMARAEPGLDIATAMAVSGAAASSNMGSASIRPLTPALALLNVRLGYWMRNPRHVHASPSRHNFYLANEVFSRLDEARKQIYLTDGGHIENLGIYQLLKRRCRLIIAVDAEADPAMSFKSFVRLQWYARIDLGIRIRLPWQAIREATLETGEEIARTGWAGAYSKRAGPHCAIGTIDYPNGGEGTLLYVKASLSGDENDYIVDYKRRRPAYPHESTSDQFFTEEQFEVYRALGFHALKGVLDSKAVTAATREDDAVRIQDVLGRLGL
jgi:hypothetical protein